MRSIAEGGEALAAEFRLSKQLPTIKTAGLPVSVVKDVILRYEDITPSDRMPDRGNVHIEELSMPDPKANILVAFYSRDGSVEALAKAVSEGAREAGAEVRLRRAPDIVSPAVMAKVPG